MYMYWECIGDYFCLILGFLYEKSLGVCFFNCLRFRFGCFGFPSGFLLRFTSACAIVLIWGWLGVCLVSV